MALKINQSVSKDAQARTLLKELLKPFLPTLFFFINNYTKLSSTICLTQRFISLISRIL